MRANFCWLTYRKVASLDGTPLPDFNWRKEPRWFQVEHDLAVNNFRLDLLEVCQPALGVKAECFLSSNSTHHDPNHSSEK
jgi:hypothetical protein